MDPNISVLTNISQPNSGDLDTGPGSISFLVFLSLFGTCGNVLIIAAIIRERKLHSYPDVFVFNVAFMDLIITSVWIPAIVPNLLQNRLHYSDPVCTMFGMSLISLACSSLSNLSIVAANRYIFICHHAKYRQVFNKVTVSCLAVATWFYGVLLTLPTLLGELILS